MAQSKSYVKHGSKIFSGAKQSYAERDEQLSVCIFVDRTCDRDIVYAIKDLFTSCRQSARVDVFDINTLEQPLYIPDLVVILQGTSDVSALIERYAGLGVFSVLVTQSLVEVPSLNLDEKAAKHALIVAAQDRDTLEEKLSVLLAHHLDKPLAFAANFEFLRASVTDLKIQKTAVQNIILGSLRLFGGSDFLLMTSNQMAMALEIAAAYGESFSIGRLGELCAVFCAGKIYRAVSSDVSSRLPLLSFLIKASSSWAGTMTTGILLQKYFETKTDLLSAVDTLRTKIQGFAGKAADFSLHPAQARNHHVKTASEDVSSKDGSTYIVYS